MRCGMKVTDCVAGQRHQGSGGMCTTTTVTQRAPGCCGDVPCPLPLLNSPIKSLILSDES